MHFYILRLTFIYELKNIINQIQPIWCKLPLHIIKLIVILCCNASKKNRFFLDIDIVKYVYYLLHNVQCLLVKVNLWTKLTGGKKMVKKVKIKDNIEFYIQSFQYKLRSLVQSS